MKLVSVNVGFPRKIIWKNREITTGIFKEPVAGSVMLHILNLEGDGQADLKVHGGIRKAVYAYPVEHYEFWNKELPDMNLPFGMFGENLTTEGVREEEINIGDRFQIGEAQVMVTIPRMPCYKLGVKFKRSDIVRRFLTSRRTGFYCAVVQEGAVRAGDKIELIRRKVNSIAISDLTRLYAFDTQDIEMLQRAVQIDALPESWRTHFRKQLEKSTA